MMTATAPRIGTGFVLSLWAIAGAQTLPRDVPGPGDAVVKHADAPIVIVTPVVDKEKHEVRLPGAFWNQHMTSWVEVALCGRPSDFLHETIVCATTTKALLIKSLREAGCRDADAWVSRVQDFPKVRGDRVIILLEVTNGGGAAGGKVETYSLDELLAYEGWGVAQGPYGWMFKGDPGENSKLKTQHAKPDGGAVEENDRTMIVRDDPQIALVLKGIQHFSQSFAEHPLAYDDWVFPMMRYGRNDKVLPREVYDSNGEVPVQIVLRKVTEEELITQSAKVWHDPAYAKYMLEQLPVARKLDKEKAELWALLPEVKRLSDPEKASAARRAEVFGKASVLGAKIEAGYATLDAAWAMWASAHPQFEAQDARDLAELQNETAQWKKHMTLRKTRAEQLAIAAEAYVAITTATKSEEVTRLRGVEITARSAAMAAESEEPAIYWKGEQARVDRKTDPRADWITQIDTQVAMADAKAAAGVSGIAYGETLQKDPDAAIPLQKKYVAAMARVDYEQTRLKLADVNFELSKREGFDDDPSLPGLKQKKAWLEKELEQAAAGTQPATQPR